MTRLLEEFVDAFPQPPTLPDFPPTFETPTPPGTPLRGENLDAPVARQILLH